MNYFLHLLILVGLYVILAQSLNLIMGYAGLLSLCHAAFFGLGAYVYVLLVVALHWPFVLALPMSVLAVSLLALPVAFVCLRLRGDFFVLGTMGLQMIVYTVLYNWVDVTQGPYGISGIPKPTILGWEARSIPAFCLLTGVLAGAVCLFCYRLSRIPFGRTLRAIRDDELAAMAIGKNAAWFKAVTFSIGGGIAAIAGALYAGYVSYVDPTAFTLEESIFLVAIVAVGGAGNLRGPVIGAILLLMLPEALRFVQLPDSVAPNVRQLIYGVLLIALMRFRPQGIGGQYAFD